MLDLAVHLIRHDALVSRHQHIVYIFHILLPQSTEDRVVCIILEVLGGVHANGLYPGSGEVACVVADPALSEMVVVHDIHSETLTRQLHDLIVGTITITGIVRDGGIRKSNIDVYWDGSPE